MAVLDAERDAIVIRLVYDGPPEAGKTTSLRALSESLARPMTTPRQSGERTLFFDWVEYTGGLFEGRQIRCQIVTVPGQTVLAHRRHGLLETADAVVFVSDSAPSSLETTKRYLGEMRATLDRQPGPRIGVILQANKRDRSDAVAITTLRGAVPEGVAVIESVAVAGTGVRETFVFAVRLALDRVREMLRDRSLPIGTPPIESAADLLSHLDRRESTNLLPFEATSDVSLAAAELRSVMEEERRAIEPVAARDAVPLAMALAEEVVPLAPDVAVPTGMIWPPVDGRLILHDACATSFTPRRNALGDWTGETEEWRFHSPRQADYAETELGRRALVEWARLHASGQRWLSGPRVLVLAASGAGTWRLWQIIRREPSLRDLLVDGIDGATPAGLLRRLLDAGVMLLAATERLAFAPCRLPIRIDTVGVARNAPLYVGFIPDPFLKRPSQPILAEHRPTLLRRELGALASTELQMYARESFPPLDSIVRAGDPPIVVEAVRDVLHDSGLATSA